MVIHLTLPDQSRHLLRDHFGDYWTISRSFLSPWSPRSLDLNSCDFWLKGFLRERAYGGSMRTHTELKVSITCHVAAIDPKAVRTTVEHAITPFEQVLDVSGMLIEHMLRLNKALCFQFVFVLLHAPSYHLVVEI
ncbi:hypothetical protein AVEN_138529-1 [Araneus ventricosus]|uniref:Uncharacterized protein n=1 Tax=Araneus ventricosus TaxID=182803 RepID=A0A4Y2GIL7_ARAVE|nr:hypothetical protein AVEN_138529-1 [Araneus ventricosus]